MVVKDLVQDVLVVPKYQRTLARRATNKVNKFKKHKVVLAKCVRRWFWMLSGVPQPRW